MHARDKKTAILICVLAQPFIFLRNFSFSIEKFDLPPMHLLLYLKGLDRMNVELMEKYQSDHTLTQAVRSIILSLAKKKNKLNSNVTFNKK